MVREDILKYKILKEMQKELKRVYNYPSLDTDIYKMVKYLRMGVVFENASGELSVGTKTDFIFPFLNVNDNTLVKFSGVGLDISNISRLVCEYLGIDYNE